MATYRYRNAECAWDDVESLVAGAQEALDDLYEELPDRVPPSRNFPSEHSSDTLDLLTIEERVTSIMNHLLDVTHLCAYLRGWEALSEAETEKAELEADNAVEEELEDLRVVDDGNVLLRCTCGTASCYEIGLSFARRCLPKGLSAHKINATIRSRTFHNYFHTKGYTNQSTTGVAQWRLENGEVTQSTSYDWFVWTALRDFFIRTRYLPDQHYIAPKRLTQLSYRCDHESCAKEHKTFTVGKYETFADTHK